MRRVLALIFLALAAALPGCAGRPEPTEPIAAGPAQVAVDSRLLGPEGDAIPMAGEAAPDFEYTMSDGTTQRLSDLRGKKVIINFWATWCEPCRQEMPDLQRVAAAYEGEVVVLGVNKLERAELIPPFAEELKIDFLLIANPEGDITERYGVRNIPTSFFIAPDGTVGDWHLGIMNYELIVRAVEALEG